MHDHGSCGDLFDKLSAYLDGELDAGMCRDLSEPMAACEPCVRYLESLRATRDAVRTAAGQPDLPEDESRRLLAECLEAFRRKACPPAP